MRFSILFFFFLLKACSYSLGYTPALLLGKYKEVQIKLFENRTQHTGIEAIFTNQLIGRFNLGNKHLIQDFSPVELNTTISSVEVLPISRGGVNSVVLVTEYRVLVKLNVTLQERWSEKVLWSKLITREASYIPPQISISELSRVSSFYNNSALRLVLLDIAKLMANDIYTTLTDRF